jgi:uncharacterized protein DUF3761
MTRTVDRSIALALPVPLRAVVLACAALLVLTPAVASARTFQGSMTAPAVSADGSTVTAQITVSAQCAASEYCGFFPEVTTVPDSQPCANIISGSSWVGPLSSYGVMNPSVSATATWSEWPTLYSGGKRACLYAMSDGTLVAEMTYVVPAPPPPPTYTPPSYTAPTYTAPAGTSPTPYGTAQHLGYNEAVHLTRSWMSRKYGRRWRQGRHRTVRCPVSTSAAQRGCYAVWTYRSHVYSKSIVITEEETQYTISGSFSSAPTQAPAAPTSTDFCSTHVCIPNYPYGTGTTVQCADGTYSHSGGKQGACSYHGGVARPRNAQTITRSSSPLAAAWQARVSLLERAGRRSLAVRRAQP